MTIRILLVEDQPLAREAVRELLSAVPEFEVVGEAGTGEDGVRLTGELLPDVVVMDLSLPGWNGIESTRLIHATFPTVGVVGLSLHSDPCLCAEMHRAGAEAFVLKDEAFEELAPAVRRVATLHPA